MASENSTFLHQPPNTLTTNTFAPPRVAHFWILAKYVYICGLKCP